jgi:acetyl esterase
MIDATCAQASYREFAEGFGPGAADMQRGWREYLPEGTDPRNPEASPVHAVVPGGAAPALVITAEFDTLREEGEAYARKLEDSGVEVRLRRYPGTIHGFFTMPGILCAAREAIQETGGFLRGQLLR